MGLSSDSLGDFLLVDPTTRCLNAVFYRECRRKGRVILLGSDAEDRCHVGKLSENGALYNSFFCSGMKKCHYPGNTPAIPLLPGSIHRHAVKNFI
ncbi:MAG: hypothetical protein D3909_07350 [Candidatus Electrothrix sp. ATG1]|nr:hypothetical protein [Candidatus Electrothrix sp. ATG1]MCI5208915.1 hypothetical protein [Candidatus Electrothrix sp. ATG2]